MNDPRALGRKYSVHEIHRIRRATYMLNRPQPGMGFFAQDLDAKIEGQVQTYILAGVDIQELEKVAEEQLQQELKAAKEFEGKYISVQRSRP